MPIDTSIADMPWLLHPANPGASLAQGVEAGSRIAANYLQGVGLAQRTMEAERQANMQQQELNAKLALAPLQQTLLQQQADKGALTIEQMLRAKQDDLEADKAFTGLQGAIFDKLNTGDLNGAVMEYAKGIAQHPTLALVDKYKALGGQLETMQKESDLAKYRTTIGEARVEAAKNSRLPADARYQQLLDSTNAQLQSELASDNPDPALVKQLQADATMYSGRIQLARDKVMTEQARIAAENKRTEATNARTALSEPEKARLKSIYKQIDRKQEEYDALPEQTGIFRKTDNPKRVALKKEIDRLQESADRLSGAAPTATPVAAPAAAPAVAPAASTNAVTIAPPASVPPSGERIVVVDRNAGSPTFGKRFYIDANDQERAARRGYISE